MGNWGSGTGSSGRRGVARWHSISTWGANTHPVVRVSGIPTSSLVGGGDLTGEIPGSGHRLLRCRQRAWGTRTLTDYGETAQPTE